jgi:hypothetical protein
VPLPWAVASNQRYRQVLAQQIAHAIVDEHNSLQLL